MRHRSDSSGSDGLIAHARAGKPHHLQPHGLSKQFEAWPSGLSQQSHNSPPPDRGLSQHFVVDYRSSDNMQKDSSLPQCIYGTRMHRTSTGARPSAHRTHEANPQAARLAAYPTNICDKPAAKDTLQCTFDAHVRRTRTKERAPVHIRHPYTANPHLRAYFTAYPTNIRDKPAAGNPTAHIRRTHATNTSYTLTETLPFTTR